MLGSFMANQLLNNVVHSLCVWGGESATWPQGPNIASFVIKENQEWKKKTTPDEFLGRTYWKLRMTMQPTVFTREGNAFRSSVTEERMFQGSQTLTEAARLLQRRPVHPASNSINRNRMQDKTDKRLTAASERGSYSNRAD